VGQKSGGAERGAGVAETMEREVAERERSVEGAESVAYSPLLPIISLH